MYGLSSSEWTDLLLSVNTHRSQRRLSPYQVGLYVQRALQATNLQVLAQALGFGDATTLTKLHRLSQLPDGLAAVISWGGGRGTLSMSAASELLRLGDKAAQAFPLALSNNISKEEARQIVQLHQRSGQPIDACVKQSLLTRPRIEQMELIIGTILDPLAKAHCAQLGNEDSTKLLSRRLAQRFPDLFFKSIRVNADKFSLLLDTPVSRTFRESIAPNSVESVVNAILMQSTPQL